LKKLLWLIFFAFLSFSIVYCFNVINEKAKSTAGFFEDQTLFSYSDSEITVFNSKIRLKK